MYFAENDIYRYHVYAANYGVSAIYRCSKKGKLGCELFTVFTYLCETTKLYITIFLATLLTLYFALNRDEWINFIKKHQFILTKIT